MWFFFLSIYELVLRIFLIADFVFLFGNSVMEQIAVRTGYLDVFTLNALEYLFHSVLLEILLIY